MLFGVAEDGRINEISRSGAGVMPNYVEERVDLDIPKAIGKPGIVSLFSKIVDLSKVQEIHVTAKTMSYLRLRRDDTPEVTELSVELQTLYPYAVIRNKKVEEVLPIHTNAAICVAQLLAKAGVDGYNPIAFASGDGDLFRRWHVATTKVILPVDEAYGLPFLVDSQLPSESIFLCVGFSRQATLLDTVVTYKMTSPWSST